jgi:hypothetical protein
MDVEMKRAEKIAQLNDTFRRSMTGCVVTRGIAELTPLINDIFTRVRDYTDFTKDNDPYNEHDFGSFEILGNRIFWKIDYYEGEYQYWCDPLSPACKRVMTIMLAEEY